MENEFNAEAVVRMFNRYCYRYHKHFKYELPARLALVRRCLRKATIEEIEREVLERGEWIDNTLKSIALYGIPAKETTTEETKPASEEVATEKENTNMENTNLFGNELQNIFLETLAKVSVDKVLESVMPQIEKRILDEYGMKPIVHEIVVGDSAPVQIEGELPPAFDDIMTQVTSGNSVMMTGPAGTGKGFMARQVAKALGAEFYEVNAVSDQYGIVGFVDANSKYVRTPFYDACKAVSEGKKAVFLFDEMDCSNAIALKTFNEALEAKEFTFPNNEKVSFDDLVIMSACNTFGTGSDEMYVGERLDESTLNRFTLIRVDYSRKIEMSLAKGDEELVDFIDVFRNQVEKSGLAFVISYRNIKQIANVKDKMDTRKVMKQCLIKSMSDDDLKSILNNIEPVMSNNKYFKACSNAMVA